MRVWGIGACRRVLGDEPVYIGSMRAEYGRGWCLPKLPVWTNPVLILGCIAAAPFLYRRAWLFLRAPFWDAHIYASAIMQFRRLGSPYAIPHQLPFIYPPSFAMAGNQLAWILGPRLGWALFLFFHFASVIAIPFILARYYLPQLGRWQSFALYLLAPGLLNVEIFFGANIASLCYCVCFAAAIPGLARNTWTWFYIAVLAAGSIKITFLALLLLPLFAGQRQILRSGVVTAVTFCGYLSQKMFFPRLYGEFQTALTSQTFAARNYGIAPFGAVANLLHHFHRDGFLIPGAVQILFVAILLSLLWVVHSHVPARSGYWLAVLLIVISLVNPRMFDYDIGTAIVPAYFLLLSEWRNRWAWLLAAVSVTMFFVGHGAIGFLFLLVSAFALGITRLAIDGRDNKLGPQGAGGLWLGSAQEIVP